MVLLLFSGASGFRLNFHQFNQQTLQGLIQFPTQFLLQRVQEPRPGGSGRETSCWNLGRRPTGSMEQKIKLRAGSRRRQKVLEQSQNRDRMFYKGNENRKVLERKRNGTQCVLEQRQVSDRGIQIKPEGAKTETKRRTVRFVSPQEPL